MTGGSPKPASGIAKLGERISDSSEVERRRAAAEELRDVGFARRQNLEKRGAIEEAAASKVPEHELEIMHAALDDDDPAVRHFTIVAIGDLGDASSVPKLVECLRADEREVKLAAIDALGDIGGVDGVAALSGLASDSAEDEDIRFAALTELEELAAKQITSGPDRRFDPPTVRGAETRAPEEPGGPGGVAADLADKVRAIEDDADAEDLLRLKASDVRAYLATELDT